MKNKYIKPTIELIKAGASQQLLAGSVGQQTGTKFNGELRHDDALQWNKNTGQARDDEDFAKFHHNWNSWEEE